ncbi:hypothetical protein MVEG_10652 [Podila verticillata NRRL 6337]|nr:hypothetical protein MVEG_10652 [Podila verticillata NRRL 6337]
MTDSLFSTALPSSSTSSSASRQIGAFGNIRPKSQALRPALITILALRLGWLAVYVCWTCSGRRYLAISLIFSWSFADEGDGEDSSINPRQLTPIPLQINRYAWCATTKY